MDPIDDRLRHAGEAWRRDNAPLFLADPTRASLRVRGTTRVGARASRLVVAGAVLLAAVAVGPRLLRQASPAAPAAGPGSVATSPSEIPSVTAAAAVRLALPGEVYSMAFDQARNRVWFAAFNISEPDHLLAVDAATGKVVEDVSLPDVENNGFTSDIKIASDGSVWLTEPYALVKYDVVAGRVSSAALTQDPSAPTADTPEALAGSWASSFAFLSGRVVLARNGVSYLTTFDWNLTELQRLPLPRGPQGAAHMASDGKSVYLTGSYASPTDDIWVLDSLGQVSLTAIKGRRLAEAFNRVLAAGASDLAVDVATGNQILPGTGGSANDLASADASGGAVAYDAKANQLVRVRNEAVVGRYSLGTQPITVTNPFGQPIKTFTKSKISAVAADADGSVWYVDATARELVRVSL
jgi:hypothetical protein